MIVEEIISLNKKGYSYRYISKKLGCSVSTAYKHCNEKKINITREKGKYSEDKIPLYQEYYNNVKSLSKTAEYFNLSRSRLSLFLCKIEKDKNRKSYYRIVKEKALSYKGGKCEKCGYNKSNWALDFHHKNPEEKDFNIAGGNKSFELIKPELDKCQLLCKNCHAEIHEEIYKNKNNDKK